MRLLAALPRLWSFAGLALALLFLPAAAMAAAPTQSFLQPMSATAQEQSAHLMRVIAVTMIVILPVLIGVPLILWRYRLRGAKAKYTPEWDYSGKLEWVLWGVPVLVIIVLAAWLWSFTSRLDPYEPVGQEPLQVQAIGLDWKWVFIYPEEGIATVDELALPVGRPVELTLTTDTVMQSMLIAPLTGQIYAMPGMTTKLNFAATRTGTAEGENTQFNGDSFGRQKFMVKALQPGQYGAWLSAVRGAPVLDDATYRVLRRRSVLAGARTDLGLSKQAIPIYFSAPDRSLFDRIVAKYQLSGDSSAVPALGGTGLPPKGGVSSR